MPEIAPDGTAFEMSGPVGAPVVALIHGLGLCRDVWTGMLPAVEAHYRVLNYDLYGHGESAPAPAEASLRLYSVQLAGLLDHVGAKRAAVVGFSIGGMINRRFALDHRDRLSSLVILNSPHDRGERAQELVEDRARRVRDDGAMATMDDALKRWFTPTYLGSGAAGADLVRTWREQVEPESYAQAAWVLANGVRELIRPMPAIAAPTLVMTCENDTGSTPAMAKAIAAEIEGAEVLLVPGLQHLGLMEDPAAFFGPILEFLRKVEK